MPRDYKSRSRYEPESEGPSKLVWLFVGILIGLIISGIFYLKSNHPSPVMIDRHAPAKTEKPKKSKSDQQKKSQNSQNAKNNANSQNSQNSQSSQNSQNLQTQFDFYNVLPKNQNQAPVSPNSQPQSSPAPKPLVPTQQALQATQTTSSPASTNTTTQSVTSTTQGRGMALQAASPPAASLTPTPNNISSGNYAVQIATMSKPADADKLKAQLLLLGFDVNITPVQKNGQTLQRVWVGPFTAKSDAKATQQQLSQNQISSKLLKTSS